MWAFREKFQLRGILNLEMYFFFRLIQILNFSEEPLDFFFILFHFFKIIFFSYRMKGFIFSNWKFLTSNKIYEYSNVL